MEDKVIRKKYLKRAEKRRRAINLYRRGFRYDNQTWSRLFNLDYSEFDIVELIQNVFDLLEMKADKKKITLAFWKLSYPKFREGW
jgi:two-component system phosphate regulon sensor histidine kinase PhoR